MHHHYVNMHHRHQSPSIKTTLTSIMSSKWMKNMGLKMDVLDIIMIRYTTILQKKNLAHLFACFSRIRSWNRFVDLFKEYFKLSLKYSRHHSNWIISNINNFNIMRHLFLIKTWYIFNNCCKSCYPLNLRQNTDQ